MLYEMPLEEMVIACNSCGWSHLFKEMCLVPDEGKIVCKGCSLREKAPVVLMKDIEQNEQNDSW